MSTRSASFLIAFLALLALLTVAASLSIDLSRFQGRGSSPEGAAILQGIGNPSELENALQQHPSDSVLQLMAKALQVADNTKAATNRLSAQVEPPQLSKDLNFASVSRDELASFRRDLKTAETNASTFLPRYAAILKDEQDQVEKATVTLRVPRDFASQPLRGLAQRHTRTLKAISLILSARADYYRAYDKYIAFLSDQLGSFRVVTGQFVFADQHNVEGYNVVSQAMTTAGKRVNELEADLKKQEQLLPEEWVALTGAKQPLTKK